MDRRGQQVDLGPVLSNQFGDRYLHSVNQGDFNRLGAKEVYRQHFGELFTTPDALFVIIGSDSGLLLKYLDSQEWPSGSRALVIELPEVISRLPEMIDLTALSEHISLVASDAWIDILETLKFPAYVCRETVNLNQSLASRGGYLPAYRAVHEEVKRELTSKSWQIKFELGSEIFIERQLENLAENHTPSLCLKNLFPGKTAILLGGGPSLDEAIPWLLEHRDQVVIIAVSRISRRLREVGLTPHLVFTVDPHLVNYYVSKEMYNFPESVVLVHSYYAQSQLVGQWHGQQLYLGPRVPWQSELNQRNFDPEGPTVTNCALRVAQEMGFSQIVLAGVDLCHTREGLTHAKGSYESSEGPMLSPVAPRIENNAGEIVSTTQSYFEALQDLSHLAVDFARQGCQVINMGIGSAKIDGVVFRPLQEVAFASCEDITEERLAQIVPARDVDRCQKDLQQVAEELEAIRGSLREIRNEAAAILNSVGSGSTQKKKLEDFESSIKMKYSGLVPLLKQVGNLHAVEEFGSILFPMSKKNQGRPVGKGSELLHQCLKTYTAACDKLTKMLLKAAEKLDSRIYELSDFPDFSKLFQQWGVSGENDPETGTHGRAMLWIRAHSVDGLADTVKEHLTGAVESFNGFIEALAEPNRQRRFDAEGIKSKAATLFRSQAVQELQDMLDGLAYYQDFEAGRFLSALLTGYVAELADQHDMAMEAYQGVFSDEVNLCTEEALTRIVSLSLGAKNYENALLAMECLASIAPGYQPNYADMLKILGRHEEAIEVYGQYLGQAPDDLSVMLKLGEVYLAMEANESAEVAFRYVLEKDSDNTAARAFLAQIEEKKC